jgi:hypothetical protein
MKVIMYGMGLGALQFSIGCDRTENPAESNSAPVYAMIVKYCADTATVRASFYGKQYPSDVRLTFDGRQGQAKTRFGWGMEWSDYFKLDGSREAHAYSFSSDLGAVSGEIVIPNTPVIIEPDTAKRYSLDADLLIKWSGNCQSYFVWSWDATIDTFVTGDTSVIIPKKKLTSPFNFIIFGVNGPLPPDFKPNVFSETSHGYVFATNTTKFPVMMVKFDTLSGVGKSIKAPAAPDSKRYQTEERLDTLTRKIFERL